MVTSQTTYSKNELSEEEVAEFMAELDDQESEYAEIDRKLKQYAHLADSDADLIAEEMMEDKAWMWAKKLKRKHVWIDDKGTYRGTIRDYKYVPELRTDYLPSIQRNLAKARKTAAVNRQDRKLRKLEIQRDALNSKFIDIYSLIPINELKLLIEIFTKEHERMVSRMHAFIYKRIRLILLPYIPKDVRKVWNKYPECFIKNPGFLYTASDEYGESCSLWVTPNIPYYFTQGYEMQILREFERPYLFLIDKAVAKYNYHKEQLVSKETSYALKLRRVKTFYDLVKLNPFWYEILVRELIKTGRRPDMK